MSTPQAGLPIDWSRVRHEMPWLHVETHHEIGSTNDRAMQLASDADIPTPLLIFAEQQTAGRGRGANRWWAAGGSLTFSLLLSWQQHQLSREHGPQLSLTVGLAVCEAIAAFANGEEVKLKWPNDVFAAEKKISGILIEAQAHTNRVVVGIGLNVNNSLAEADDAIRQTATSLVDLSGISLDRTDVLLAVLNRLFARFDDLVLRPSLLVRSWNAHSLLAGRQISIDRGTAGQITGLCQHIDDDGALVVLSPTGSHRIVSGTVRCL